MVILKHRKIKNQRIFDQISASFRSVLAEEASTKVLCYTKLVCENSIYDAHLWNYSSQTSKILNVKSQKIIPLNQRAELTNLSVESGKEHILVFNEGNLATCPIREEINKYFRLWLLK